MIMAMVGVPVLLMSAMITVVATDNISAKESIGSTMGRAQAMIKIADPSRAVNQRYDGDMSLPVGYPDDSRATPAKTVPGRQLGQPWTAEQVQSLTGGRLIQVSYPSLQVSAVHGPAEQARGHQAIVVPAQDLELSGLAALESGRWPRAAHEAVVTESGIVDGLPRQGPVSVTRKGQLRQLNVVGVVEAQMPRNELTSVGLVVTDPVFRTGHNDAYLLHRDDPVTWQQVQHLNAYGLVTASRAVIVDPPTAAEIGPEHQMDRQRGVGGAVWLGVPAGLGIFLVAALLSGSAFAVTASRQRRQLALLACTGAEPGQLRRYLLGQALILGAVAAAVGAAVGIGLAGAIVGLGHALGPATSLGRWVATFGPFQVPVVPTLAVLVAAVLASAVGALVSGGGRGRMNVVSELDGRREAVRAAGLGRLRLGFICLVTGLAAPQMFRAAVWERFEPTRVTSLMMLGLRGLGLVALLIGGLLLLPVVLWAVERISGRLSLPLRLAAREVSRHRTRSVPAIAAIMVAVAALTTIGTFLPSLPWYASLLGAVLMIMVGAWVSTAMAQTEAPRDRAALAAIGATPRLRRAVTAGHAWLVAVIGTLLGVLGGEVARLPGGAPWPWTMVLVVFAPALAAAGAAVGLGGTPPHSRRLT